MFSQIFDPWGAQFLEKSTDHAMHFRKRVFPPLLFKSAAGAMNIKNPVDVALIFCKNATVATIFFRKICYQPMFFEKSAAGTIDSYRLVATAWYLKPSQLARLFLWSSRWHLVFKKICPWRDEFWKLRRSLAESLKNRPLARWIFKRSALVRCIF